jgi:hypothetical protein
MPAKIPFSTLPGRHERHYQRKLDNPLFAASMVAGDEGELLEVQRRDHDELIAYLTELRALVQRAVTLRPNEASQVILDLKSDLDKSYEKACTLADDQRNNKQAIAQLLEVVMSSVQASAGDDPAAQQQLEEERLARTLHFRLLEHPIVADLLDPQSLVQAQELVPSLLSESEEGLAAALELFDDEQLQRLVADAQQLLGAMDLPPAAAQARLRQLQEQLQRPPPCD